MITDDCPDAEYQSSLDSIKPLDDLLKKYIPKVKKEDRYFMKELVLWGLAEYRKLSKERITEGYQFKDLL